MVLEKPNSLYLTHQTTKTTTIMEPTNDNKNQEVDTSEYDEYAKYTFDDHEDIEMSPSKDLSRTENNDHYFDQDEEANANNNQLNARNSSLSILGGRFGGGSADGESWIQTVWIALAVFFVVVATVLGTGILALPVNVGETGFAPFVITITTCWIAQTVIMLFMIELLQRTQALMDNSNKTNEGEQEDYSGLETEASQREDAQEANPSNTAVESKLLSHGPDLHTMAKFFLNRPLQIIFEASVMLHFVSILVSYSLAGTEAYAQLFNISDKFMYLITPFVLICTLVVVLGHHFMQYIITGFTLIKGTMLVVMVMLVGYAAGQINVQSTNSWQYIGRPFLIGTVALGGAMNTLPVIYAKMKPTRRNILVIQISSCLALFICYALNVLWCYFVLQIVPQKGETNSLEAAKKLGQISTGPVINIIEKDHPQYAWMAKLVSAFVTLSVTVSYVTMSSGMKHMLDGYVKTFHAWHTAASEEGNSRVLKYMLMIKTPFDKIRRFDQTKFLDIFMQISLYVVTFGLVWLFAQVNYHAFFMFLEVFTSCALNLESGFFVAFMLFVSRKAINSKGYQLSVTLPSWFVQPAIWIVGAYFMFAVAYDFVYTVLRLVMGGQDKLPF